MRLCVTESHNGFRGYVRASVSEWCHKKGSMVTMSHTGPYGPELGSSLGLNRVPMENESTHRFLWLRQNLVCEWRRNADCQIWKTGHVIISILYKEPTRCNFGSIVY
jgi:hypothetical protein